MWQIGFLGAGTPTAWKPGIEALLLGLQDYGYVASLARPGGNVTGSSFFSDEITAKRLEILRTVYPAMARVGFLTNPQSVAGRGTLRAMEAMAQSLNVQLQLVDVRNPDDLESALASLAKANESR
jgi:putative ABC transport system substrate-binding protein